MARDIWFISDTHFGDDHAVKFAHRPFANAAEADAFIAQAWAERVKPEDLVYHLGDVAWNMPGVKLFASLPGTKRLLIGNHDDAKQIITHVQKLELFRTFRDEGFIASHLPMMPERGRPAINVHGHVHNRDVQAPGYVNICVEKTGYRPLHLDELRLRVQTAARLL